MTELFIIRHGEYEFNDKIKPFDRELTQQGISQAEQLRDKLAANKKFKSAVLIVKSEFVGASSVLRLDEVSQPGTRAACSHSCQHRRGKHESLPAILIVTAKILLGWTFRLFCAIIT
jgi:bisphosphoglycerate-dependent phosphoglycerate mutase